MLVFVDKNSGRPCRPPQEMADVLAPFFSWVCW
jgi:acyl-CoA thioesterase FadM